VLIKRRKEIHEKIGRAIENLYPQRLVEFSEILAYVCRAFRFSAGRENCSPGSFYA
jgi:hypothetical protein